MTSNVGKVINAELENMSKEVVVACFTVPSTQRCRGRDHPLKRRDIGRPRRRWRDQEHLSFKGTGLKT
jgi:hypothetical protein